MRKTKKKSISKKQYLIAIIIFFAILLLTYFYKKFVEIVPIEVGSHVEGAKTQKIDPLSKLEIDLTDYTNKGLFSGSVLVAKGDKILLRRGFGLADRKNLVHNEPETRFRIGSLTKSFTAASILILQDRKILDTEDPIVKYIPEFAKAPGLTTAEVKQRNAITIHELLTNQSGIKNYFTGGSKNSKPISTKELVTLISKEPLEFEPGSQFEYSNSNYTLLTFVIERVSKTSYEEFLKANIFEVLDMKNTGFDKNKSGKEFAKGYVFKGKSGGKEPELKFDDADYLDMSYASGSGGLYSTVDDLYKWDQALYDNLNDKPNKKILSKELAASMFKPDKFGYAYGWNIKNTDSSKVIWHDGIISGFTSYFYRYPNDKATIIILRNLEQNDFDINEYIRKLELF